MSQTIRHGSWMLGLLAVVSCSVNPETAKHKYVAAGDRYTTGKRLKEAAVEYRRAVQVDPKYAEARYKLAQTYEGLGDPQNAMREFVRAADLMPRDVAVQLKAGQYLLMAGRFDEAKARAESILKQDVKNVDAYILLGSAYATGLRDLDQALNSAEEAVKIDPMRSSTYLSLGAVQYARGNNQQAETAFKNAVRLAPNSVGGYLALANYYWAVKRTPDAEKALKRAFEIDPQNLLVERALAYLYMGSGREAEAEPYFQALAKASEQSVGARLVLADYYTVTKRLNDAKPILTALAKTKDGFIPATLRLAIIGNEEGHRPESYEALDHILARDPHNSSALVLKSRFLLAEHKVEEALKQAHAAVQADPRSVQGHYTVGMIELARRNPDEAIKAFNEVLKLEPRMVDAQLRLSQIHLSRGAADTAEQLAAAAVQNQPRNGDAHLALARAEIANGNLSQAEAELNTLIASNQGSATLYSTMGSLQRRKRDRTGASTSFTRALELEPNSIEAVRGLVALDFEANRPAQASARIESKLAARPDDPDLLRLAVSTYVAAHDLAKAEEVGLRAIKADPSNLDAYGMLGVIYSRQGKLDDGLRIFDEGAKRDPKSVPIHTMAGMILQIQGKPSEARKQYEQALEINHDAAVAANNLAMLYADRGENLDVALQLAQTAKSQLPDRPEVNDTLGWVYYKKQLAELAIPVFQRSTEQDPKNPLYKFHLGLAYAKSGDKVKARRLLEQALSLKANFDGADEARQLLRTLQG